MTNTPDISGNTQQDVDSTRQSKVIDNPPQNARQNNNASDSPTEATDAVTHKSDLDGITRKVYL